jgi:hypothetical protein
MRAGIDQRSRRHRFGLSTAVDRLPCPVEIPAGYRQFAPKSGSPQNSKSLPAGSSSSKKSLNVRGTFTTSDSPSRSYSQPESSAAESGK